MSKQLFVSSALSVLMMAAYALLGPSSLAAPDGLAALQGLTNPLGQVQAAAPVR